MLRKFSSFVPSAACLLAACALFVGASAHAEENWIPLWDGKTFDNWKAGENEESWTIEDGALVCKGERSHLFYVGPEAPFKNFVFEATVKTTPGSNAGIYFHSKYQQQGWPKFGYEAQVNNSGGDPKKTGSLYGTKDVAEQVVKDGEWYTQTITVKGNHIEIAVNGKTLVSYDEPESKEAFSDAFERRLSPDGGTFALQAHDPKSVVYFKDLKVKKLD